MIRFDKVGHAHFIVIADEPCRVEVTALPSGNVVAFAYQGTNIDKNQDPVAVFDSHYQ